MATKKAMNVENMEPIVTLEVGNAEVTPVKVDETMLEIKPESTVTIIQDNRAIYTGTGIKEIFVRK